MLLTWIEQWYYLLNVCVVVLLAPLLPRRGRRARQAVNKQEIFCPGATRVNDVPLTAARLIAPAPTAPPPAAARQQGPGRPSLAGSPLPPSCPRPPRGSSPGKSLITRPTALGRHQAAARRP